MGPHSCKLTLLLLLACAQANLNGRDQRRAGKGGSHKMASVSPAPEASKKHGQRKVSINGIETHASYTGTALEIFNRWSEPPWSRQRNGTVCAPMSLRDFLLLQALFSEVAGLFAGIGVKWFLSHGSLLGAWLHHSPVPWDEEGDVVLLPEDFARLKAFLGPPPDASFRTALDGRMSVYEGPHIGALQYDYHEHRDAAGVWLATAVTFRHASEPRNSSVHVDAFLARTNTTHAWTDSAIMPLEVIMPVRLIRFYDWLAPAPFDPEAALRLWYGPSYVGKRKCALRSAGDGMAIERIAAVSGRQISAHYPMVKNEWLSSEVLRCTLHLNRTALWVVDINTRLGDVLEFTGLPSKPRLDPLVINVPRLPVEQLELESDGTEFLHDGAFPTSIPNMWD